MREPMHQVTVAIAPDGAVFVTVPILPPVGEPELRLVLERRRWIVWWCGRRVGGGVLRTV